jgi:hypothetical protein
MKSTLTLTIRAFLFFFSCTPAGEPAPSSVSPEVVEARGYVVPKAENKSVGMKVTADRIALLNDRKETSSYLSVNDLILPDGRPGGTEVLMKIPVSHD